MDVIDAVYAIRNEPLRSQVQGILATLGICRAGLMNRRKWREDFL